MRAHPRPHTHTHTHTRTHARTHAHIHTPIFRFARAEAGGKLIRKDDIEASVSYTGSLVCD